MIILRMFSFVMDFELFSIVDTLLSLECTLLNIACTRISKSIGFMSVRSNFDSVTLVQNRVQFHRLQQFSDVANSVPVVLMFYLSTTNSNADEFHTNRKLVDLVSTLKIGRSSVLCKDKEML